MPRQITLPDGAVLTLSPDQDRAVTVVLSALQGRGSEAVLAGAAGTGKTTVMNAILQEWKSGVMFMAPTGKAANRLAEQTGEGVRTIHSAVFKTVAEGESKGDRREALVFGEPDTPRGCHAGTLVVVDEASMVNQKLAAILREVVFRVGARILWVGDHEQLPPVEGRWGCDLQNPTARLTQVHRQALKSPVLELATLIRQGMARTFTRWGDEVSRVNPATVEQAVEWSEEAREAEQALLAFGTADDTAPTRVLLTWTNKIRALANRITRKRREYPQGEVVDGETLLCLYNNHDLGKMNGELIEASRVEECPELTECLGVKVQWVIEVDPKTERETKFLVIPSTFDAFHPRKSDRQVYRAAWKPLWARKRPQDPTKEESVYALVDRMDWSWNELRSWRDAAKRYALQGTWGYCLTVHKSQGSQWDEVGFISCPSFRNCEDAEFKRRFTYTAVTRAAERFTAFMLAVVPDYRRRNPYGDK